MSNPPAFTVPPGQQGMAFKVQVFVNGVDGNGLPISVPDMTSPLTFEDVQNSVDGGAAKSVSHTVDPNDNRRVIVKSLVPSSATGDQPFSFRVKCPTATSQFVTVSGTAQRSPDLSGISWDGVAPAPA